MRLEARAFSPKLSAAPHSLTVLTLQGVLRRIPREREPGEKVTALALGVLLISLVDGSKDALHDPLVNY